MKKTCDICKFPDGYSTYQIRWRCSQCNQDVLCNVTLCGCQNDVWLRDHKEWLKGELRKWVKNHLLVVHNEDWSNIHDGILPA